ncbi:hypothetical protein B0T16DRAFT_462469 [Cercophora newfieldiana]|uniref:Uncharacterized protein n=1 Tax=Cercophora newfieldiana TaxID=92897 RepID=A0AA39XSS7_9PEZI|nr:hypothetical protein B0T16DRAFT_462469 [Cercophora newfieldiana]
MAANTLPKVSFYSFLDAWMQYQSWTFETNQLKMRMQSNQDASLDIWLQLLRVPMDSLSEMRAIIRETTGKNPEGNSPAQEVNAESSDGEHPPLSPADKVRSLMQKCNLEYEQCMTHYTESKKVLDSIHDDATKMRDILLAADKANIDLHLSLGVSMPVFTVLDNPIQPPSPISLPDQVFTLVDTSPRHAYQLRRGYPALRSSVKALLSSIEVRKVLRDQTCELVGAVSKGFVGMLKHWHSDIKTQGGSLCHHMAIHLSILRGQLESLRSVELDGGLGLYNGVNALLEFVVLFQKLLREADPPMLPGLLGNQQGGQGVETSEQGVQEVEQDPQEAKQKPQNDDEDLLEVKQESESADEDVVGVKRERQSDDEDLRKVKRERQSDDRDLPRIKQESQSDDDEDLPMDEPEVSSDPEDLKKFMKEEARRKRQALRMRLQESQSKDEDLVKVNPEPERDDEGKLDTL